MSDNTTTQVESFKAIEVKSQIIDKLTHGAWTPESTDGKRYHLFVKIYRGNGLEKAAGIEFEKEEDALMAQNLVHSVINEVLA